ncbi:hypothetical protein HYE22_03980 [Mycoplasmopsis bovis]|nr:hypothetical protein [Mycoplasmopsis bovis]QQH24213.1 hypothetical protein HYE22_03980 [Mycoplasmopsis bovis]
MWYSRSNILASGVSSVLLFFNVAFSLVIEPVYHVSKILSFDESLTANFGFGASVLLASAIFVDSSSWWR